MIDFAVLVHARIDENAVEIEKKKRKEEKKKGKRREVIEPWFG